MFDDFNDDALDRAYDRGFEAGYRKAQKELSARDGSMSQRNYNESYGRRDGGYSERDRYADGRFR